jgi:cell fate (sporulation/competence/biofilm development) regulator YlbF (YheA/YmcA/DUF963 family)
MMLSNELHQAAQTLGESLRQIDSVQAYLTARALVDADPEAHDLEQRLLTQYDNLIARQQAGEELAQAEVDEFYALRGQTYSHPLVAERENALQPVKAVFAGVGAELSAELGFDYTALARAA